MKTLLKDIDTSHLAWSLGHKLTKVHRVAVMLQGWVYLAKLDNGPFERLTEIRHRLEAEYLSAERKQGHPVPFR